MRPAPIRRLTGTVAVALTLAVAVAGCGSEPVSPLPVQPPATSGTSGTTATATATASEPSTASASPSPAAPTTRRPVAAPPAPTRTRGTPPRPAPSSSGPTTACQGAVRYDLPLAETELELLRSLCFATGAVLRIQGIGPGLVTVDRPELVSQQYEAGVVDIRFVRPGTVAVTIPQEDRAHTITVVVR
ncbi:hypothetical protein DKT68_16815 [Micromonospora acroterricola]|uniref:Uncharacterized protein n=1 Tax=Micromonospora acroterricola TaxID=2202421 RepID=A0A317CZR9_9ACTN|nr:hypothetical protein [Micromonospora acroterricola]PWR08101.1 hypothetical protein DKT68_16815 [Micromonospora acroterricola]